MFQGRFKSIVVEADEYLNALSRYIHLNPVRAKITFHAWEYAWSSCRFFAGTLQPPDWLEANGVLGNFGRRKKAAQRKYVEYISQKNPFDPSKDCMGSSLLGSDSFVEWIKTTFLSESQRASEIPELKNLLPRPSVESIIACVGPYFDVSAETILRRSAKNNQARDVAIYLCRQLSGQTCQALGKVLGRVSGAAIAMRTRQMEDAILKNRKLKQDVARLQKQAMA